MLQRQQGELLLHLYSVEKALDGKVAADEIQFDDKGANLLLVDGAERRIEYAECRLTVFALFGAEYIPEPDIVAYARMREFVSRTVWIELHYDLGANAIHMAGFDNVRYSRVALNGNTVVIDLTDGEVGERFTVELLDRAHDAGLPLVLAEEFLARRAGKSV